VGFFTGVIALSLVLSACTTDWTTWGNNNARTGENGLETTVNASNVASLKEKWSVNLGKTINASPILAHNIDINGTPTTVLYTGSEEGVFFAISTSGKPLWFRQLATVAINCDMYPNGIHGVSGSAVFDRATNRVYVTSAGYVYALDASTGATIPGWPVQITTIPAQEVMWGGLTLNGNNLYAEVASHCDSIPYHGRIIDIDPTTATIADTFYVTGSASGPSGGGIWGWGGVSVDNSNGDVYAATGNSFANPQNTPYGDSVIRLSSSLALKASDTPSVMIDDDDFGSTPVLFQKSGCPAQLAVLQKNGSLYLYDRDSIASGPRQRVVLSNPEEIGVVAYSNATQMLYAVNHSASGFKQGVVGFSLNSSCDLTASWSTFVPVSGSNAPMVAGNVVYVAGDYIPNVSTHKVYALNAVTGAVLWDSGTVIGGDMFAQPIVVDGQLYTVAYDGKLYCFGL
jgi:outer membrane protein assembly factor BamB